MSDSEDSETTEVNVVPEKDDSSSDSYDDKETAGDGIQVSATMSAIPSSLTQLPPQPRRKRFVPKYEVEGVGKVILGEETQLYIEMVVGTHVNAQYPWKSVSKNKILETIELNGELSEFFPFLEEINAYGEEDMLLGYIVDESKDTDEFYLCYTVEAKDHCKQQSDRYIKRQEKKLEKAVHKKPKPWVGFGSEKEIYELIPIDKRNLMEVEVKTKFPTLYEPETFQVRDTNSCRDGFIELTPYRQKFNNIYKRRVDCAIQCAPARVNSEAQTVLKYPQNMWTQSIADALGKNKDPNAAGDAGTDYFADEDAVVDESDDDEDEVKKEAPDEVGLTAYREAFQRMRRPSYVKRLNTFMSDKATEMNSIVELNTVMDIYGNDYPNLVAAKSTDIYESMTFEEYVCFTDVRAKDKYISSAVFHPMWSGIVAISYSDGSPGVMKILSSRPDPIQRAVYGLNPVLIWSHIDSLIPKLYLESPREVKVLSFCPYDENVLVGGLVNGQIVIWDLTHKLENVETIEVLSETREKYRIAMNSHMSWMKPIQDKSVVSATALSNLMTSHYGPVTTINWFSPNFNITPTGKVQPMPKKMVSMLILTGSEDGNILIWNLSTKNVVLFENKKVKKSKRVPRRPSALLVDVSPYRVLDRNLVPCYKIILGIAGQPYIMSLQTIAMDSPPVKYTYTPRNSGLGRKYFTCEIIPQADVEKSTVLYCGSQHGEVRRITWEGHEFNTGEVVNSEYCDIKFRCFIHDGIITRASKNPFINHLTVTVGGKIFAIWSDKLLERPLMWKKRKYRLTDAAWSSYKPSLLFIATSEGYLESWDLLLRSDQPIAIQTLSGNMLTGVSLHTLPLAKNIIGVSDSNASFRMFLNPPIFMIENPIYIGRLENMLMRELKVMQTFINWQNEWMKNNPQILLEMKRKEGLLLAEKEEQNRRLREEEEKRLEEEAEVRRIARMKVIGPEERWQKIIQKLIERTIAVKKRINRAELIEHEKPLRELEMQRLEKERRMLEIMKNQKNIFNDTVAILFPEAIKKDVKAKKSFISVNRVKIMKDFLEDYEYLKGIAQKTVKDHPYQFTFSWDATLAEGKERRQALNAYEEYITTHKQRILLEGKEPSKPILGSTKPAEKEEEEEEEEKYEEEKEEEEEQEKET